MHDKTDTSVVLHSQNQHTDVRSTCVEYLKKNRENYEAFIEGNFEEYLSKLEDPQHWVGEVEISALSLMYKRDFIIFQTPGKPPVEITDNGFGNKVRLCFLNGNHYDSVYPVSHVKNAALCQSILYELLYERVCGTDRSAVAPCLKGAPGNRRDDLLEDDPANDECCSSDESEFEGEEPVRTHNASERGHRHAVGRGRGGKVSFLSKRVRRSLNPFLYRNTEYDVWVKSKRAQQKMDFCIAAGMQYTVGDKCKVRLGNVGRYYGALIQEVSSDSGPVTVFIEELGSKHSVPLWNLRPPSDDTMTWSTVARDGKRLNNRSAPPSEWESRGAGRRSGKPPLQSTTLPVTQATGVGRGVLKQHSWPPQVPVEEGGSSNTPKPHPRRTCSSVDQSTAAFGLSEEQRLARDEEQRDLALVEIQLRDENSFPALGVVSNLPEGRGNRVRGRTVRRSTGEEERNIPSPPVPDKDPTSNAPAPPAVEGVPSPSPYSVSPPTSSPALVTSWSMAPSASIAPHLTPPQSATPPLYALAPFMSVQPPQPQPPQSSLLGEPPTGEVPPAYSQPPPGVPPQMGLPDAPHHISSPSLTPQSYHHQAHLYQDLLFPGFPMSDKEEVVQTPAYSYARTGEDLPRDVNVLRFFFNLGVKAYTNPMWLPYSYIVPLQQAFNMQPKLPSPYAPAWYPSQPQTPSSLGQPLHPHAVPREGSWVQGEGYGHPRYPSPVYEPLQDGPPPPHSAPQPLGYPSSLPPNLATTQPVHLHPETRLGSPVLWHTSVTPRSNSYGGPYQLPTPHTHYPPQAPQPCPSSRYPAAPQTSANTPQAYPQPKSYPQPPAAPSFYPPSVPQGPSISLGYAAPRLPSGNPTLGPQDSHPAGGMFYLGMRSSHSPLENHSANAQSASAAGSGSATSGSTHRERETGQSTPLNDCGKGDVMRKMSTPEQVTWVAEGQQRSTGSGMVTFRDVSVGMATPNLGNVAAAQMTEFVPKATDQTKTGSWGELRATVEGMTFQRVGTPPLPNSGGISLDGDWPVGEGLDPNANLRNASLHFSRSYGGRFQGRGGSERGGGRGFKETRWRGEGRGTGYHRRGGDYAYRRQGGGGDNSFPNAQDGRARGRGCNYNPQNSTNGRESRYSGGLKRQGNHFIRGSMTTPSKTPPGADPKQLERTGTVREIGSQAVWSLSSCKPGFGVDQLRDDNLETYWQSDGSQPHLVNIQFRRKTTVKMLCIYADYKSDESYTPSKISVRVGNNFHNLQEIRQQLEMVEPSGWIHIPLLDSVNNPIRTFMIQIAVLANHQNGRDTHMRQIKVYTPVEESSIGKFPRCTTVDFMMYRTIR
ncbi:hypothetical protein DPEC_G00106000 [Dallia pectoralis]|uniref:Uncharacterized protein n=1 Tax=Dallia pectoralis TaxID=75939 RepID=A0ACC2GXY9_DALPE|nr:hypothetical protein DPEC_G00106000 [Dallia pectoralis]